MNFFDQNQEDSDYLDRSSANTVIGIVSDVKNDPQIGPVARVTFPDCDGKVSDWLPVIQRNTVGTSSYSLPRLRERVLVHKLPNGPESAVVDGSVYCSAVSNPPVSDQNDHQITFDDGSVINASPKSGSLMASMTKAVLVSAGTTIYIYANGNITINTASDLIANVTGKATVTTGSDLTATVGGNLTANVSGDATITASNATIKASTITLDAIDTIVTGKLLVDNIYAYQGPEPTAHPHMLNSDGSSTNST